MISAARDTESLPGNESPALPGTLNRIHTRNALRKAVMKRIKE